MSEAIVFEVFIVIKDGTDHYYLLKVERRGFDVYCFLPHLVHYTKHESGETHFRADRKAGKPEEQQPVVLQDGEAGRPINGGFMSKSLRELGNAYRICSVSCPIDSLSHDFPKFNRSAGECFVIDTDSFPKGTSFVNVEVWAVPASNKASFEFNNPDVPADALYKKVAQDDLQIWMYAQPF